MKDKKLLLIFVKNPERGKVKTRLAKTVGEDKAYQTYLKLLSFTIEIAGEVQAQKQIWYSSFVDESDDLGGPDFEKKLQKGANLGERMLNAFQEAFDEQFEKVVIIGSDCPDISPEIVEGAFAELDKEDVVIGPSEDGGYYLLGLRKLVPEVFRDISWSTESVYPETVQVLKNKDMSFGKLPTLNDIDTEEDLSKSDFE